MSAPDPATTSPSALRLVLSAERLFAQHGIDGVSLRQIAADAGTANNSAVHYYFGSKDALVSAIFGYRLPQLIRERQLLSTRTDPDDVRARFEAHYLPVLALAEAPDNHYVSFVEQLQRREVTGAYFTSLPEEWRRSDIEFRRDLARLLGDLGEPLRTMRVVDAQAVCLHAAANRERAITRRESAIAFDLFASALFDGITGYLLAPPSAATLRHVRHADDVDTSKPRLL